ncbi:MAG: DUF3417 domain-containing protein, partial [Muribaculaceae bacterium]|nr:DUF3417 domain-containing protein [Muribaculaceae bacterium]
VKTNALATDYVTGTKYEIEAIIDTNGIGKDLGLELVVFKKEDGEEHIWKKQDFDVVKEEGNVLTYKLVSKLKDPGVYRYSFRLYPKNPNLPHRQDFAFTRWI